MSDAIEDFPKLSKAPIVEAVIELRGHATATWEPDLFKSKLEAALPDLKCRTIHQRISFGIGAEPSLAEADMGFTGCRLESQDKKEVVRIEKTVFAYSRLAPYPGWEEFRQRALKLWAVHQELAAPGEVSRMGLRYVNKISIPSPDSVPRMLKTPPRGSSFLTNLDFENFYHKDSFTTPGKDFGVHIVTTLQLAAPTPAALIVDIDAYSTRPWLGDTEVLSARLSMMRQLKNSAFFGILTDQAVEELL